MSEISDEQLLSIAKRYAYRTFELCLEKEEFYMGEDPVPRTRQNCATKVFQSVLKLKEVEAETAGSEAPMIGEILSDLRLTLKDQETDAA